MAEIAIKTDGLGKEYRIGARQESYRTLRDLLARTASAPSELTRRVLRGERRKQQADERYLGPAGRHPGGGPGRGCRHHRPERRGEEHPTQNPLPHHPADCG